MTRVTWKDLEVLWNHGEGPCVSLYLPTHRKGADAQTDPIRLKNLAREAEHRLVAYGLRDPEARALLAPVDALQEDRGFWQHQGEGLAVFCAPGLFRTLGLNREPAERVVVGARFHTRPLLPMLEDNAPFYVLAVSQNAVRLLRATTHEASELALPDAPRDLKDFRKYEDPQQDPQLRQEGRTTISFGGSEVDFKDVQRR
jgi:hypothetical protein